MTFSLGIEHYTVPAVAIYLSMILVLYNLLPYTILLLKMPNFIHIAETPRYFFDAVGDFFLYKIFEISASIKTGRDYCPAIFDDTAWVQ